MKNHLLVNILIGCVIGCAFFAYGMTFVLTEEIADLKEAIVHVEHQRR